MKKIFLNQGQLYKWEVEMVMIEMMVEMVMMIQKNMEMVMMILKMMEMEMRIRRIMETNFFQQMKKERGRILEEKCEFYYYKFNEFRRKNMFFLKKKD